MEKRTVELDVREPDASVKDIDSLGVAKRLVKEFPEVGYARVDLLVEKKFRAYVCDGELGAGVDLFIYAHLEDRYVIIRCTDADSGLAALRKEIDG